MCNININIVGGRSYEIFQHENLSYYNNYYEKLKSPDLWYAPSLLLEN